ncbi:interferon-related developmental regulator-domain-containing protein [Dichotomocladium elegans]|nr:interferon-related developmental regulator-domain-containing protein [Dichotomocladium elegans]
MSKNLAKKASKQKARMAALNALGTPGSSRAPSEDEADDLDTFSEASFSTADSTALLDETTLEDELRRSVDDLGEKRTSTREASLKKINRLLGNHYCGTFFSSNSSSQVALLMLLLRSLRKAGSSQEAVLAAKGIGLMFVSEGDVDAAEHEDLFGMVLSTLKSTITNGSDPNLKLQCIETLGFVTFIAASKADTRGGLDYFYNIMVTNGDCLQPDDRIGQNDMDVLVCASLKAYGLLYASIYGDGRGSWEDAWDESQA